MQARSAQQIRNDDQYFWFDDGYLLFNAAKKQYNAVFEVPPIIYVVLAPGGCRGLSYVGAIEAFDEFKVACDNDQTLLSQLEGFYGGSIGAVIGAHVACGMRPAELKKSVAPLDFNALLGQGWTLTWPFSNKPIFPTILRDAKPLYELLRHNITESIALRLQEMMQAADFNGHELRAFLSKKGESLAPHLQAALSGLANELEGIERGLKPTITFIMLEALHQINPVVFKGLDVSTVCRETGEACYLSAMTAPDLEIALACVGSAAIPAIVQEVPIPKKYILAYRDKPEVPDVVHMVDGGYLDTVPVAAVETKHKKVMGYNVGGYNQNLQTVIVMPDDTKAADYDTDIKEVLKVTDDIPNKPYQQSPLLNYREYTEHELAPPSFFEDLISNVIPKWFGIKSDIVYTKKRESDLKVIKRIYSEHNIPIHSGIRSLETEKARLHADEIMEQGKQLTLKYLRNRSPEHGKEGIYFSYQSLTDLLKQLPEEKYRIVVEKSKAYPSLASVDFEKINRSRERHKHVPVSLWPKFNNFMQHFYRFTSEVVLPLHVFKKLQTHFDIISMDDSPSDDVKMLRALSVIFDHDEELMRHEEGRTFLKFFSKHFNRVFRVTHAQGNHPFVDVPEHSLLSPVLRSEHYQVHRFHVVYQRIMFMLKQTKSSLINPEDTHHIKRKFVQTIINDIQDLIGTESLLIDEASKLKRLEDHLFEAYHKVLFYKGTDNSNLARTLKKIIQSPQLLNLPFYYSIKLPTQVNLEPDFARLNQEGQRVLEMIHNNTYDEFIKRVKNVIYYAETISAHYFTFSLFDKNKVLLSLFKGEKAAILYHAIVRTMLVSPYEKDRFYATKLTDFMTSIDVEHYKETASTLFYAASFLTRLMWISPKQKEKPLYDKLIATLVNFMHDYQHDNDDALSFLNIVEDYFQQIRAIDKGTGFLSFFSCHSAFYSLMKNFITKELRLNIVVNARDDSVELEVGQLSPRVMQCW